ncbi:hypothetical protein [Phytohabitans houttuyneae]|uniref:Uncharacterized protein n=1 Tax=Phytohabitans houttuyneae TaxID=1076126 RepID=A0A6V8KHB0_9ACTN|nr:hypothetical protein [Phytohabitans houttuyneae]GFJ81788.1 hypothetical protein Phou_059680 [Phytohabitans houttuyneae]
MGAGRKRRVRTAAQPAQPWWRSGPAKWIGTTLTVVLTGVLVGVIGTWIDRRFISPAAPAADPGATAPASPGAASSGSPAEDAPFTVAVSAGGYACGGGWLIEQAPAALPKPRKEGATTPDWPAWAESASGLPAVTLFVTLTIQGTSDAEVILHQIRPVVVKRAPPPAGTHAQVGCGGDQVYRWLAVDLDTDPPTPKAEIEEDAIGYAAPQERRPIKFPYGVTLDDAESFLVIGKATRDDVYWQLEIKWAAQGRTGTYIANDNGRPFRVAGTEAAVAKCLWEEGGNLLEGASDCPA